MGRENKMGRERGSMSDRLKEISERLEDYPEPARQDIAHLLAVLYMMERENEKLRERVRKLNEHIDRYLAFAAPWYLLPNLFFS